MTETPSSPTEPKKNGVGHIIRLVVSVVFALGVIASVGTFAYNKLTEADRDKDGNVTSQGKVSVDELKAGDCVVENIAEKEYARVEVAPCAKEHSSEIYATFELEDGDFPGDKQVDELAGQGCYDRFETFVGISYDDSALDMTYLLPLEDSWDVDRGVACMVMADGATTGSFKGAKR
ncbi:septum formation family protein [Aeromicrobium panaciterrae]|uniref:septum formation family protein n=1 Tax=Aeromicrobium panaciterrae TaxID=363861 RepID=UPI0031D2BBE9